MRDREIAIHGSKQYVIDTIMKMRNECGYDDFCFLGWFELGGFHAKEIEEQMQIFAEDLRKRFRLPVHMWDERLTSAEANRLLRETELSIEKRGKAVDRMAAVLILQGWMERRGR